MPVEFVADGRAVKVGTADGRATATIYLHGATVTSWTVADGSERLYLSSKAVLDGTKAIRGGIPLVFPQFGVGPQSPQVQHGFARTAAWQWLGVQRETDPSTITVAFGLENNGGDHHCASSTYTWPHAFRLRYEVTLDSQPPHANEHHGGRLVTQLHVTNTGTREAFQFTALLHTYLRVVQGDVETVRVHGLQGLQFQDKTRAGQTFTDPQPFVAINDETDRSYLDVPSEVRVDGAQVQVQLLGGFRDVVVWNPGPDKAKTMADLGADEYRQMVCVEVGAIGAGADMSQRQVTLGPGDTFTGGQTLTA